MFYKTEATIRHKIKLQEQNNVKDILHQALQDLNSKDDKSLYFDLHNESLITHGLPTKFPSNKEGMKSYYTEVWQAFPEANFSFDHVIVEGNEAACMFTMTGTQKGEFLDIPQVTNKLELRV